MACEMKVGFLVFALIMVSRMQKCVHGQPKVPCYFIFGDSLADNGNNNGLPTLAKVNYPPYGIDFPNGPTGRFSNGKTNVDLIAELLGFPDFIPPFANPGRADVRRGLNYASGSAGILVETGNHLGRHISLGEQVNNHQIAVKQKQMRGSDYLKKCLYSIGIGSNDYINNYFKPNLYPSSRLYNPEQYADSLIGQYTKQIQRLYELGARKIALIGVGLIGCTPNAIGPKGTVCVDKMNSAVQIFNGKLKSLVDSFKTPLNDLHLIYINMAGISSGNPSAAGFKVTNVGCCPVNNVGQCTPNGTPCANRSEYVFWDSFHPTEAINHITAGRSYKASDPSDAHPFDISRLVGLQT